ncbi:MAG: cyclic nucleotide-binding domain-containing protein [Caldilinea sp.]|nr:cyclic nucleotide-binding domain-containing protein [Caldilinea sp.]MDW8439646.1 cyclic nucleotide-binding domain-containing protein [Caldilineaceae bacterium]
MKEEFIQYAPLFAGLAPEEQKHLAEQFSPQTAKAGAVLFRVGEAADGLYLIGKGFVRIFTAGGATLATLGPGSVLGEDSLYRSVPYDVSAHAASDLEYWKLSDADLRAIILQRPTIGLKLSQNFGSLIAQMQDYLILQLSKTSELKGLPPHTLRVLADHLEPRKIAVGQVLYRAGDAAGGLFLIESGRIEIQPETGDGEREEVGSGRLLGALALLTNKTQTATAIAREESLVWTLSSDDFHTIAGRQPGLRRGLAHNVSARLSRSDQMQAVMRLSQMPIFSQLPPATIQAIAQRMVLQHAPAGDRVYRAGELGDAMYLVESGEVELTAENAVGVVEEIGRVGAGGFFGELSLLTGQIRVEDATAVRNTNLWVLKKADLDALAAQYPAIGKALSQGLAARLASIESHEEERLRRFVLFADLSAGDLRQIAPLLRPMRYRAGELIYRASAPADKLFLIEQGNVRVQTLTGGAYLLGPGESFGERALITEQPHNTTVSADTDVDVWTLSKQDLDMLMNRYPAIAISLTRIITQRLSETAQTSGGYIPPAPLPGSAPVEAPSRRRQQAAPAAEPLRRRRRSFGEWYAGLSPAARIRFILLMLLLLVLLCVTVPFTITTIINGIGAASRAMAATLNNALDNVGPSADVTMAERLRLADAQVPPTPTYTPFPTSTPLPTLTPTPTQTPLPTPTSAPVVAQAFAQAAPVAVAPVVEAAAEEAAPTEEVVVAAAVRPRVLDSRLGALGVTIEDASVEPGQPYWRLVEVRWEDEQEAGGKHHIYVDVLDENGNRVVGQPVTVFWGDGSYTAPLEDKPAPDLGFNFQMYAAGYAYGVRVEGLPSDVLRGAGLGDLEKRFFGIHVSYYLVYQRTIK